MTKKRKRKLENIPPYQTTKVHNRLVFVIKNEHSQMVTEVSAGLAKSMIQRSGRGGLKTGA